MIERREHITPDGRWLSENMFIEAGEMRLFACRSHKEGSAPSSPSPSPTLVFLHEGLGSVAQWGDFPLVLGMKLQMPVFVYDRCGHGRSSLCREPRGHNYLHQEALTVLPLVLRMAGIERPVLVGHSDGGSIALLYASAYPRDVAALVVMAAHTFVEKITVSGVQETMRTFAERKGFREALRKYHGDKTESLFYAWGNIWTSPAFYGWNIEDCLPKIGAPLLVIQGANDEYASARQVESIVGGVASEIVQSFMVEDSGHSPHNSARSAVLSRIADFIGKVGGTNNDGNGS